MKKLVYLFVSLVISASVSACGSSIVGVDSENEPLPATSQVDTRNGSTIDDD